MAVIAFSRCQRPRGALGELVCRGSASPGTAGCEGRPPEQLALSQRAAGRAGRWVQPVCGSHRALAVASAGRGTGRASGSRAHDGAEGSRGGECCPCPPRPPQPACAPGSAAPDPTVESKTKLPGSIKPTEKGLERGYPGHHPSATFGSLVAVPPRALCQHWCPCALGGLQCRWALQ